MAIRRGCGLLRVTDGRQPPWRRCLVSTKSVDCVVQWAEIAGTSVEGWRKERLKCRGGAFGGGAHGFYGAHGSWVVYAAYGGGRRVTAQQAAWVPGPGLNSVWAWWTHLVLAKVLAAPAAAGPLSRRCAARTTGRSPIRPMRRQAACRRAVGERAAAYVAGLTDESLASPMHRARPGASSDPGLHCPQQLPYCEIISVRHTQGLWPEDVTRGVCSDRTGSDQLTVGDLAGNEAKCGGSPAPGGGGRPGCFPELAVTATRLTCR